MSRIELTAVTVDDDGCRSEVRWLFGNVPRRPRVIIEYDQPVDLCGRPIFRPGASRHGFTLAIDADPDDSGRTFVMEWSS